MKSYAITFTAAVILSLLIMAGIYKEVSFLSAINSASLASLILIIVGASMLVVQGGFFNGISYSFKRFYRKSLKSTEGFEDEVDDNEEDYRPTQRTFSFTFPALIVGILLFLLTLALSYTI
ncbi:MAG TPA: DUF3899 domain-containing protein [Bacillales bacterium]|nr:DUF3899 domain-containing protein [Bacillales bacterium]